MVKKLNRNAPHLTFCRGDLPPIFTRNSTAFWLLMIQVPVLNFRYILNPDSMALFRVCCVTVFHISKKTMHIVRALELQVVMSAHAFVSLEFSGAKSAKVRQHEHE